MTVQQAREVLNKLPPGFEYTSVWDWIAKPASQMPRPPEDGPQESTTATGVKREIDNQSQEDAGGVEAKRPRCALYRPL